MRPIPASSNEVAIWGRSLRGFPGAHGTGYPLPDPELNGNLYAAIPIPLEHLKLIWRKIQLSEHDPQSAWHELDRYESFALCLRAQRFKISIFSTSAWYCEYAFALGKSGQEVRSIYLTSSKEQIELFHHAELLLDGDFPPRAQPPGR